MRFTTALCRQHMGFAFKIQWHIFGKRKVTDTNAAAVLTALGKNVSDPQEYLKEFNRRPRME